MFWKMVLACVVLSVGRNDASPTRVRRMAMSKMKAADLEGSATAYVYNQQQGLPVYYLQYTNHGSGQYYHAPNAVQYVAPVAQAVPETAPILLPYAAMEDLPGANELAHDEAAGYGGEQPAKQALELVKSEPRPPYYAPEKVLAKGQDEGDGAREAIEEDLREAENVENDEDDEEEDDHGDEENGDEEIHGGSDSSAEKFDFGNSYGGNGESRGDGDSSYEAGGAEKHESEKYSRHGEKGDKGYRSHGEFSKSEEGLHDDEDKRGYYSSEGGRKKGHVDEAENDGSHEEAEKSSESNDYGHSSRHKKGHKTNGFHNVYHKDEYKKETDFYDDDHKKGYFDKFEEFEKGYRAVKGDFKKGGHYSSGHDHEDHGQKGHYDKGHLQSQDQGHEAENGQQSYYKDYSDYGEKKDATSAKMHKYRKHS